MRILLGSLDAAIRAAGEAALAVSCLSAVFLLVIGTADIVGTQILGVAVPSGIELQEAAMGLLIFAAFAGVQRRRAHIIVDVLLERLGPLTRRALDTVGLACTAVLFAVLAWQQWLLAARAVAIWEVSPGFVAFPLWAVKAACAGAMVVAAAEAWRQWLRALAGRPDAAAAPAATH